MSKLYHALIITLFFTGSLSAQFGYGLTGSIGLYDHFTNPKAEGSGTAGNVLFNLGLGPKIWVGGSNFSVSAEGQAVIGLSALAIKEYRGLGSVSYPIMVNLNFNGLSGFDSEARTGFSFGGGIQYTKTELFYQTNEFKESSDERHIYTTYIGQFGYGFGVNGFGLVGYIRYGYNENGASTASIGVQLDFNAPKLQSIVSPESSL